MPPDKNKTTIYDVADRAGVAISTVSRVLNNSQDVSEQTRARVLKAIDELKFRPDRTAKTLAQKQTRSIAVAIPTFTTPFHNELLKGVRLCLRDYDLDLLLCDLGSTHPQRTLMTFLKRGTVDGLLLAGLPITDKLSQELLALRSPVVLIGAHSPEFDSYSWDDVAGAQAAVEHLLEQGHRRIGLIRSHVDSELQDRRIEGYTAALDAAGVPFDESLIKHGSTQKHAGFSEEAGYESMKQLLEVDPPVTAVFACSDVQAIGARKATVDAGRSVPQDVALVGYDDIKTSRFVGLSSVSQNMHDVGMEATQRLVERVMGEYEGEPEHYLLKPELQVRESSQYRPERQNRPGAA